MSRISPAQVNFNGGEISRRLHARHDLNLYDIAVGELTGWVPLPEGGVDACPGLIWVKEAAGACRLLPFEYSNTQAYIVELSAGKARFYTNDGRIEVDGAPMELALPYPDLETIEQLTFEQSYDVLYLFHPRYQTRLLTRTGADSFTLELFATENGPFEPRNKDEAVRVVASNVTGEVSLRALRGTDAEPLFTEGDVGGLFQVEADDFGDVRSWEPGISVTRGQLLVWNERVYRVVGGGDGSATSKLRTGTLAPTHAEGVEWDGIGQGKDINEKDAGGVQLEFRNDRFGLMQITAFISASEVKAKVLHQLPLTSAEAYDDTGGYYDPDWGWTPGSGGVSYVYGTWRWRFGAFSDRRGWPSCGIVWNERLLLAKDSTLYGSVAGDLRNHATYNELGEISTDMAFVHQVQDPNGIVGMVAQDKAIVLTGGGMYAVGPSNAASGVGPGNLRSDRQNNEGAASARVAEIDGRTVYIGKSRRRVIEADYDGSRDRRTPIDLTRYARHIGTGRFFDLASQKDPNRLLWALRGDGSLACAAYVPEEQVLGWATRPLAPGLAAKSIAVISDPTGELQQLWVAAIWRDAWHVLRLDQFREESTDYEPAMVDMAAEYEGDPASTFGPVPWLAGATIDAAADGYAYRDIEVDDAGMFELPNPASRVTAGLPFPARLRTLRVSGGGDNGPALDKMKRISRVTLDLLGARGLRLAIDDAAPRDIEQALGNSVTDQGFAPQSGIVIVEDAGDYRRETSVLVERVAPLPVTLRAIQATVEVSSR